MPRRSSRTTTLCAAALILAAGWPAAPSRADFPPPPLPTDPAWFDWYDALLASRLAACPRERSLTFHFAQSGDDATGDGSLARPFRSLAKAQQLLDAHPAGNIALLFRRGDTWREDVGIDTDRPHITIADYGDGEKPILTPFRPVDAPSWSPAPGVPNVYQRPELGAITWVRDTLDVARPMVRASSLASVAAIERSWFWDQGSGTLYVHPEHVTGVAEDPRLALRSYEVVKPRYAGIIVRGHGTRVENIVAIGWGMWTTSPSQQHGIEARNAAAAEVCIIDCESYYGSSHAMVFFNPSDYGGIATFVRCKAGFTSFNQGGAETVFNAFTRGDAEIIFHQCDVPFGTLPDDRFNFATRNRARGFYAHATTTRFRLIVSKDSTISGAELGAANPSHFDDVPSAANLAEARVLIVGERFDGSPRAGDAFVPFPSGVVRINGLYTGLTPAPSAAAALAAFRQAGWLINSVLELDLSNISGTYALYNAPSGAQNAPRIWNSAIHAHIPPGVTLRVDRDVPNQSAGASAVNSVFVATGGGTFDLNLGDAPGDLASNAYFGVVPGSFAWDADPLVLLGPAPMLAPPPCSTGMVLRGIALPEGSVLGHDASGWIIPRRTIGPFEGIFCLDLDASGEIDMEDLYQWHAAPTDLTGDAIVGPGDARAFELYLRDGEIEDMRNGRQARGRPGSLDPAGRDGPPGRARR